MIGPDASIAAPDAQPRVSVIVPVYNHERYVEQALRSVLDQTFTDWELVVIDDGSTDGSLELVRDCLARWCDPRLRLLTQPNAGSHATINRGLSLARGHWLTVLNSDDRFDPSRLAVLVALADQRPGPLLAATAVRLIDGDGAVVGPGHPSHGWWRMYEGMRQQWTQALARGSPSPALDALLWGNFTVSTSNLFLSRELLAAVGPLGRYRYVLDWEFALRVALEQPQAFVFLEDQPLLDYRLHGANTILGGAIHNHVEAAHVLRRVHKRLAAAGRPVTPLAVERLRYLDRFVRQRFREQAIDRARRLDALEQERVRWLDDRQILLAMQASTSWRLTAPLRAAVLRLRRVASGLRRTLSAASRVRRQHGLLGLLGRMGTRLTGRRAQPAYAQWLQVEASHLSTLRDSAPALIQALASRPRWSVVVPVHDTPLPMLRAMVASVQAQLYPDWTLCLCDDASTDAAVREALDRWVRDDPRIRLHRRAEGGHIVRATQDALALADGDYVVFLDHDDELAPHALLCLTQALADDPEADLLYSDEDKIDTQGRRSLPLFKPDWSPMLLWSQHYLGHAMAVRRTLLNRVGGLRPGTEGAQDHDLALRLVEAGARVRHVPQVLYHWRQHPASTAVNAEAKPYAHEAGCQAVGRHLRRRYGARLDRVEQGPHPFVHLPRFRVPTGTRASILIPTRDRIDLLRPCIDSILRRTTGAEFELIVIDNGSVERATADYLARLTADDARVRVLPAPIPFNWSRLNNLGRRQSRGQVLVFLNNDTLVISPDWLQRLMEYALLPDVATVGPLLLFEDGTVQHAGVVVGMGGWADHVHRAEQPAHFPSPFVPPTVMRNVLANTGACLAIAADTFDALGGFDETFEICGSDVELGIRAHRRGLHNVYLPSVRLHHLESKSRSPCVPVGDFEQSALKYAPFRTEGDPFYNPHLDPMRTTPTPRHAAGNGPPRPPR